MSHPFSGQTEKPDIVVPDSRGLACPAGGFWVDPWRAVPRAVVTHGHTDHARPGMGRYWCAVPCEPILRRRLGRGADIVAVPYRQPFTLGEATMSFHPAGHCLGSAQVRIEAVVGSAREIANPAGPGPGNGSEARSDAQPEGPIRAPRRIAVVAGDYKRAADPTCDAFELVPCDTFVTEATFALPIYRWRPAAEVADELLAWWDQNAAAGRVSLVAAYALGKAQRLLGELALACDRAGRERPTVPVHGALAPMIEAYRGARVRGADGAERVVDLLPTRRLGSGERARGRANPFRGTLVLAPPGAVSSAWVKRLGPAAEVATASASGWMQVRGLRRRGGYDRGFVISDHADWPDLIRTCRETGAERVLCTHGRSDTLARYLREELGLDARPIETAYTGEGDEGDGQAREDEPAEPAENGGAADGTADGTAGRNG